MDREERKIKRLLDEIRSGSERCPALEELVSVLAGSLSAEDAERVREHLASCPACLEQVRIELLLEEEESGSVSERTLARAKALFQPNLVRKVLNFFQRAMGLREPSGLRPAFAFRGAEPAKASQGLAGYVQEFGQYRAEVEVEQVNGGLWQVIAWVENKTNRKPARGIRVSLLSQERELESLMLDKGRAVFEPVPAGEYRLNFQKQGKPIAGIIIRMKGEGK